MWIFHPHFFHSLFSLVSSSRGRFGASRRSSSAVLHCCSWCAVWRKFQSLPDGQTAQNPFCRPPNLKCEVLSARKNRVKMTNIKKMASEAKCTIVVIGDSRTGKSVLLHRFVHKTFQPVSKNQIDIYLFFQSSTCDFSWHLTVWGKVLKVLDWCSLYQTLLVTCVITHFLFEVRLVSVYSLKISKERIFTFSKERGGIKTLPSLPDLLITKGKHFYTFYIFGN